MICTTNVIIETQLQLQKIITNEKQQLRVLMMMLFPEVNTSVFIVDDFIVDSTLRWRDSLSTPSEYRSKNQLIIIDQLDSHNNSF